MNRQAGRMQERRKSSRRRRSRVGDGCRTMACIIRTRLSIKSRPHVYGAMESIAFRAIMVDRRRSDPLGG
jgi:hypothetical protein